MNKWTPQEIHQLETMWADKASRAAIVEAMGRNWEAVSRKALRLGLPPLPATSDRMAAFTESLSEHGNIEQAGKAAGVNFARAQEMFASACKRLGGQALGTWRIKYPE